MLGFEIGQRESGFYSERTESQTDRIMPTSSTVLYAGILYNCICIVIFFSLIHSHMENMFLNLLKLNQVLDCYNNLSIHLVPPGINYGPKLIGKVQF